jgi:protein-disulfide isomerase
VWIYAALTKLGDPDAAVRAVRAYEAVPEGLVELVAWGLPFVELALAVLLLGGVAPRAAAWVSLGVLAVFIVGIASVWARGLKIDCGCFGTGGAADVDGADYAVDIARDVGIAGLAIIVAVGPSSAFELRPRLPQRWRARAGQAGLLVLALTFATVLGVVVQGHRSDLAGKEVVVPGGRKAGTEGTDTPWISGSAGAPVRLDLYEDLTCADCRAFHEEVEPALAPLVQNGTLRILYHPLPLLGDDAVEAAAAAACAFDAGAFAEYRDALYAVQVEKEGSPDREARVAIGTTVGITHSPFVECVEQGTYEGWVRDRLDAGSRHGVVITPTVFVDGNLLERPLTRRSVLVTVRREADPSPDRSTEARGAARATDSTGPSVRSSG